MNINLPRETLEFLPVTVTVDGVVVTSGVKFSVTTNPARPSVWMDPVTVDGKSGVMTSGHTPGTYHVWAQVTDSPEIPVIYCGWYRLT